MKNVTIVPGLPYTYKNMHLDTNPLSSEYDK